MRRQLGDKFEVELRIDDMDLGKIVVLSPDKQRMFSVPALAPKYASGLTRWQHGIFKRYAAREMKKFDSQAWLEAKENIRRLVEEEFMLKKQHSRSRIARFKGMADKRKVEAPAVDLKPPHDHEQVSSLPEYGWGEANDLESSSQAIVQALPSNPGIASTLASKDSPNTSGQASLSITAVTSSNPAPEERSPVRKRFKPEYRERSIESIQADQGDKKNGT
jgi:hypothetical protein